MIRNPFILLVTCGIFCICPYSKAGAEPQKDPLQVRIEKIEKELSELKQLMKQEQERHKGEVKGIDIDQNAENNAEKKAKEVAASRAIDKFQFEPYGYIKLDASYDDSRTNYGNFVLYVPGESENRNDDEFNMTARQTRLGMNIAAPHFGDWRAQARIEVDFYGDGSSRHENKAEFMLRHAFFRINKEGFGLIAGQTQKVQAFLGIRTQRYPPRYVASMPSMSTSCGSSSERQNRPWSISIRCSLRSPSASPV